MIKMLKMISKIEMLKKMLIFGNGEAVVFRIEDTATKTADHRSSLNCRPGFIQNFRADGHGQTSPTRQTLSSQPKVDSGIIPSASAALVSSFQRNSH